MREAMSLVVCAVAVSLFCLSGITPAQAEEKPLLSAKIQKVLDDEGAAAALSKFKELFPAQKDRFEVDLEGFGTLASSYAQAGEMEKMQAVIEMTTLLAQDAYGAAMPPSRATARRWP